MDGVSGATSQTSQKNPGESPASSPIIAFCGGGNRPELQKKTKGTPQKLVDSKRFDHLELLR